MVSFNIFKFLSFSDKIISSILSIGHFDRDGKSLYFGVDKGEKKMFDIKPDSTAAALQKEVCLK